jgi:hypothetical protein
MGRAGTGNGLLRSHSLTRAESVHFSRRALVRFSLAGLALLLGRASSGQGSPGCIPLFASPQFLPHAHSHNDYQQRTPCLDAIAARLTSVEADLWCQDGIIVVGHDRGKWRGAFETLYLKPLNDLWERAALPVGTGEPFLLWLDLKDPTPDLGTRLDELLQKYAFTRGRDPNHAQVQVILTGNAQAKESFVTNHPNATVTRDSNSFLEQDAPGSAAWSWYALNWKEIGKWDGVGEIPPDQREGLQKLVGKIHANGRKLRLWNHPATLAFWQEAIAAGVDRLGTDLLPKP